MDERPATLYERLHTRGYTIERTVVSDLETRLQAVASDPDIVEAYQLLLRMRRALLLCQRLLSRYADDDRAHLDDHMTMVEKQALNERIGRHQGIADVLQTLIDENPRPLGDGWMKIVTAPQDGKPIRLLGQRDDGRPYIETGHWVNIKWSVEDTRGYLPPTHWAPMEALPEEYRT